VSTPRLPQPIRKGQRLGNKIPVDLVNAGREALKSRQRDTPMMEKGRRNRGGGGEGGSDTSLVMVYDDLQGGSATEEGLVTWGDTVRCLPMIQGDTGLSPDLEASFTLAVYPSLGSLELAASGCCGSGASAEPTGPRFNIPFGEEGINRIKNGQSITFTGTGAVPGEELTLTITDGTNTVTPSVTNNGDGTWTSAADPLDTIIREISSVEISNGPNRHKLLLLNSEDEYEPGVSNATGDEYWTSLPNTPDLFVDSDTGESSSDNITDDRTPTFTVRFSGTEFVGLASDVQPRLVLINQGTGEVIVVLGSLGDFSETSTTTITLPEDLDYGVYEVQLVLYMTFDNSGFDYDEWWSPPSPPLRVQIVEDAEAVPAKRYARLGFLTTIGGVKYVTVDSCPRVISEAEAEKLDE
jgi:hypothetical protein